MNFIKKFFVSITIFLILFCNISFASEPEIYSKSAILVEESTGKILFEKNIYEKMYPASTTKVMTAILVLENCNLDEIATVSYSAVMSIPYGYVNASLSEGEEISVRDLMYALMLKSANDAAVVLAEHVAGSVSEFSNMMNQKALELGCKSTHFVNPNGIHNDDHYSTAYDLYLIAKYAMQNETFRQYVTTRTYTLPATNKYEKADRIMKNTNSLIFPSSKYYNENVIGIKTGYTSEAQNCLISAAKKDNICLFCITLNAGTTEDGKSERFLDANSLYEYGFNEYDFVDIIEENSVIENIEIENGNSETKSLNLIAQNSINVFTKKQIESVTPIIELNEKIQAPIPQGEILGTATYKIDGEEYKVNLLAEHDVIKKFDYSIILWGLALLCLIIEFGFVKKNNSRKRKNKKNKKTDYKYYKSLL